MEQGGCYRGGVLQGYVVEKWTSGALSGGESSGDVQEECAFIKHRLQAVTAVMAPEVC